MRTGKDSHEEELVVSGENEEEEVVEDGDDQGEEGEEWEEGEEGEDEEEDEEEEEEDEEDEDEDVKEGEAEKGEEESRISRKKKKSKVKEEGDTTFRLRIATGDETFAGTSAKVSIELQFENGDVSKRFELSTESGLLFREEFQRGGLDERSVVVHERGLPEVVSVTVEHDNSGLTPSWLLDHIEMDTYEGEKKVRTQRFPCKRWLSSDEDDGGTRRVLLDERLLEMAATGSGQVLNPGKKSSSSSSSSSGGGDDEDSWSGSGRGSSAALGSLQGPQMCKLCRTVVEGELFEEHIYSHLELTVEQVRELEREVNPYPDLDVTSGRARRLDKYRPRNRDDAHKYLWQLPAREYEVEKQVVGLRVDAEFFALPEELLRAVEILMEHEPTVSCYPFVYYQLLCQELFRPLGLLAEQRAEGDFYNRLAHPLVWGHFEERLLRTVEHCDRDEYLVYTSVGSGLLLEDFILLNLLLAKGFRKIHINLIDDRYSAFITHKTNHAGPLPAKSNLALGWEDFEVDEIQSFMVQETFPPHILEGCLWNFVNWFMNVEHRDESFLGAFAHMFSVPEHRFQVSLFEDMSNYAKMVELMPERFSAHLLVNSDEAFVFDTNSFHFDTLWVLKTDIVRETGSMANMGMDSYSRKIPCRHAVKGELPHKRRERNVGILAKMYLRNGQVKQMEISVSAQDTVYELKLVLYLLYAESLGMPVPFAQSMFLSNVSHELHDESKLSDFGIEDRTYFHEATLVINTVDMEKGKFAVYQCHAAVPGVGNIVEVEQTYFHPRTLDTTDDSPHPSYLLNYNTTLLPQDLNPFGELETWITANKDSMGNLKVPSEKPHFETQRLRQLIALSKRKAGIDDEEDEAELAELVAAAAAAGKR